MAGRLGEKPMAMINRATFFIGCAVIKPPNSGKGNGARAHRAGLECHMQIAANEPFGADFFSGLPDDKNFCMSCRIMVDNGAVTGNGENFAISDNNGSDRNFAHFTGFFCCFEGVFHRRHSISFHHLKKRSSQLAKYSAISGA